VDAELKELEQQLSEFKVQECEVYSRVVGYYQKKSSWNPGKQAEDKARVNFNIGEH